MLLENGKYVARSNGIVIYETEKGALCAAIKCQVVEGEKAGTEIKTVQTLAKQDGTLQERTISTLKEVFGWTGADPFWLAETDLSDKQFEIDVEGEQGTDGKVYSKVKWINPLGGGPGVKMPAAANKTSVLAKYGSRFRALAGGAPMTPPKPAANTPPPPPAKKTAAPPPPSNPGCTMEEAWQALWDNNPGIPNEKANEIWQKTISDLFPGKTTETLTPEAWGAVKAKVSDNIPY